MERSVISLPSQRLRTGAQKNCIAGFFVDLQCQASRRFLLFVPAKVMDRLFTTFTIIRP